MKINFNKQDKLMTEEGELNALDRKRRQQEEEDRAFDEVTNMFFS